MWPCYRAMNCYNLFEIIPVSQFTEYAKIQQIMAIINRFLAICKYNLQLIIICRYDFRNSRVHFYLSGSIL